MKVLQVMVMISNLIFYIVESPINLCLMQFTYCGRRPVFLSFREWFTYYVS